MKVDRKLVQFSIRDVLVVTSLAAGLFWLATQKGLAWFLLGVHLVLIILTLWLGTRWAIYGTGTWSKGPIGLLLGVLFALGVLLSLLFIFLGGLGQVRPLWLFVPPL